MLTQSFRFRNINTFLFVEATLLSLTLIGAAFIGFDISDEGLYAFLADPLQPNPQAVFNYDLFFKLIFSLTELKFSLIQLRLLRLLGYLIAAWSLAVFLKNYIAHKKASWQIFSFTFIGICLGYAFLPQTLSYNSLNVTLTCVWLAILSIPIKKSFQYLLIGVSIALIFYVKFPTAILLCGITYITLFYLESLSWKWMLILLPLLLFELLFWTLFQENAVLRLSETLGNQLERPQYNLLDLMKSPLVGIFWLCISSIGFFLLKLLDNKSKLKPFLVILSCLIFISVVYLTHITQEWNHLFLLTLFLFVIHRLYNSFGEISSAQLPWVLILTFLPFILHLGSNVYWLRIGIHYAVFWMLLVAILSKRRNQMLIGLSIFSFIWIINGLVFQPFEQSPLFESKSYWKIPDNSGLFLDSSLVEILEKLQVELDGEDNVLAFFRNPGLAYLLGKNISGQAMVWDPSQLNTLINFEKGYPVIFCPSEFSDPILELQSMEKTYIDSYKSRPIYIFQKQSQN
ncbi:hypothetical protein GYM62_03940 [Algoriphagus sp. NBT04N3]|uniref:hypothetical protein n=1 Tax=Algoriphagus sp. NBT04N3 TaxID=2705473 RepID=UPI001C62C62F|nr:hypothetical protein [Algoriphagus sp. NBT04N3]QYH37988.1 hypothetical protein GYM62_03940 [Algoriphagus sp. NBT04N3]